MPKNNFYRRLKQVLDLDFLFGVVAPYYGPCGQQSIDPIVFFKLLLVGHLENLVSHRAIIPTSQLRLDMLYFLGYSVDKALPRQRVAPHSTRSRTRQRLPATVFETCFQRILSACVEAGMVAGETQAIDSRTSRGFPGHPEGHCPGGMAFGEESRPTPSYAIRAASQLESSG